MEDINLYNKEYRIYMEFALQNYLVEKRGVDRDEAETMVLQDFEGIKEQAMKDKYI